MPEEKDIAPPEAPESAAAAETAEEPPAEAAPQGEAPAEAPAEEPAVEAPAEEPVVEAPQKEAVVEVPAEAPAAEAPVAEAAAVEASGDKPEASGDKPEASAAEAAPAAEGEDTAPAAEDAAPAARRGRRMGASVGVAHIRATFNNTLVSISDLRGGVISWSSAGRAGFKGSRKSTAFAATMVGQDAARQAVAKGMHEVEVHVQGAGSGRESAIRALQTSGLVVTLIKDVTPMPHNGCRQRKRRRV